jgi:glycerophosphoryl diester phosphodiesterase
MQILAHRGYWQNRKEQNTKEAFIRAFGMGSGVETDLRDCNGEVVISHDMPVSDASIMCLESFFELYKKQGEERWSGKTRQMIKGCLN